MTFIRICLAFVSVCCVHMAAYSSECFKLHRVDRLYEESDLAALITVKSGEKLESSFEIQGVVDRALKGTADGESIRISFLTNVLYESPNTLGATYLVHLKRGEIGVFEPLENHGSVIEVSSVNINRPDFDQAIQRLGLAESDHVATDSVVWYPIACAYSDNKKLCGSYAKILKNSMEKEEY